MNGLPADQLLGFLSARRSERRFDGRPIAREVLDRLLAAAVSAPSSSNRQPWRFTVVTDPDLRRQIAAAVRERAQQMQAIVQRSHHAADYGRYGDFFHEPLEQAAAIVIPQYRCLPDLIAELIASGGGDPGAFHTAASMQAELCSASAAVMLMLLQARAEGLGACWMAGPMIARDQVLRLCRVPEPWQMLGAVALGHLPETPPGTAPDPKPPRKPIERIAEFLE
jgi:nitroreductase